MKNEIRKSLASIVLIIMSFMLIMYGILDKEVMTVFNKAIKICLECIGIG